MSDTQDIVHTVQTALGDLTYLPRRRFLRVAGIAGGGMVLAAVTGTSAAQDVSVEQAVVGDQAVAAELNAFIQVASDGTITIFSANAEMGQGIKTALPMIIAEEMGARWQDVRVLQSPVNEDRFGRQRAGGSTTIPRTWDQMRQLGASAREMFISAGALVMELPADELSTADSQVRHQSGRAMTFGQLASLAAKQTPPDVQSLKFKERDEYTILGTSVSGVDNLVITTGAALFGIDTRVPDMLYAAYQKCPAVGGKVVRANLDEIKQLPGIVDAFVLQGNDNPKELLDGVAVVGTDTYSVFEAKRQLQIEWDERQASKDSWQQLVRQAERLQHQRGTGDIKRKGDVESQFADPANTTIRAFYEYPFVAHLCMEPMNCTAHYQRGREGEQDALEVWLPHQIPTRVLPMLQDMFGLSAAQVTLHQMRLGGSFGRRVYTEYVSEAVAISKHVNAPVKLTWTREDDIQHDFYRVGGFQSVTGALDGSGRLVALENHFIGMQTDDQPVMGSFFRATEFPFLNIAHTYSGKTLLDIKTPCGPWRAPGSNTTAFVLQSFLHELAHAAGRDHLEFLLELMGEPRWFEPGNIRSLHTGRAAGVIRLAAQKAGWGKNMPAGRGLGLAFYFSHAGHIAEVADVSVDASKKVTVHSVTVAVDVGPIVNRSGATSQVAGSVIDGLSTMMGQKITMENGRIEQSNFHDYPVLRLPDAPPVDIHFIESDFAPTGLGEPALPPLAPAVTNAIFAATGQRVRKMPLSDEGYSI